VETVSAHRWRGRRWLAVLIKLSAVFVPLLASLVVAAMLAHTLPVASALQWRVLRFVAIAGLSTLSLYGVDRIARRLLPLAALFDLTLVFPDKAPSRYRMALRSGSRMELQKRVDDFEAAAATATPAQMARGVLELVADLSRHDRLTRGHSERVRAYAELIGEEMGLDDTDLDRLRWAALLHDIGKLQIDAMILNKPGSLTPDEFALIREHPMHGKRLSAPLHGWLGESARAVWEHHERWDGGGYPAGLHGTQISVAARIVAVADAFDVMTSIRSYKKPGSAAAARAELARCAGGHFDPAVVRAFLNVSLGRLRFVMGPASWFAQLAFIPRMISSGSAVPAAAMAAAGIVTTGLGIVTASPSISPVIEAAAKPPGSLGDPSSTVVTSDRFGDPTTTVTPSTVRQPAPAVVTSTSAPPVPSVPASAVPAASATSTSAPVSAATTASSPSTVAAPPPSTMAAPPPSIVKPTPSTNNMPTTTSAPSTTTTVPAAGATTLLLASTGSGDVASAGVLPLAVRAPQNTGAFANLDADRNADPGLTVLAGGALDNPTATGAQRFQNAPGRPVKLRGAAQLEIFASDVGQDGGLVSLDAGLYECGTERPASCSLVASATASATVPASQWTLLRFDFGSVFRTVPASRRLEVRVVVGPASDDDVWLSWDHALHPSALRFDTA
jgi:HD-GYP domain-containing protein (c-di-GMP phosphodiesterase class II)